MPSPALISTTPSVQLFGRSSSHFTRTAALVAHELEVPFTLIQVHDLEGLNTDLYGGNPALKLPTLVIGASQTFGTANICRKLAEHANKVDSLVWSEQIGSDAARNAQELTWHAMAAQVQLILGIKLAKLPADNIYFAKIRTGLQGSLAWLDANLELARTELSALHGLSMLEVTLFCLIAHLTFRKTVPLDPYPNLARFAADFAERPSAQRTPYTIPVEP